MIKPIIFVLLFVHAISMATPIGEATGNYTKDLGQIKGIVDALRLRQIACAEQFPAFRETISKAMIDWNKRNQSVLDEIEERLDELVKEASSGDPELAEMLKLGMKDIHKKRMQS